MRNVDSKQYFKTARMAAIDPALSTKESEWPKADSGKVFILDAVNLVGRARFGAGWTGMELQALVWTEQPEHGEFRRTEEIRVGNMLAPINGGGGAPGGRGRSIASTNFVPITNALLIDYLNLQDAHVQAFREHLHELAVQKEQFAWAQNDQSLKRLTTTLDFLAQHCRDGQIRSFVRHRAGGYIWPMEAWEWNIDNVLQKFAYAAGFKRYFAKVNPPQSYDVFIFIDWADIDKLCNKLGNAPMKVTEHDLAKLSPFLRLAVQVALSHDYTLTGRTDTMPVREAEIASAWKVAMPGVPQSETAIKAIARVIGFPNPAAILQGSKAKTAKSR